MRCDREQELPDYGRGCADPVPEGAMMVLNGLDCLLGLMVVLMPLLIAITIVGIREELKK